jgi:hypothetical protein
MYFIDATTMGILDSKGKNGICGIDSDNFTRLKEILDEYEIRVYHIWPYYTENSVLKYRIDTDELSEDLKLIIKLSFP